MLSVVAAPALAALVGECAIRGEAAAARLVEAVAHAVVAARRERRVRNEFKALVPCGRVIFVLAVVELTLQGFVVALEFVVVLLRDLLGAPPVLAGATMALAPLNPELTVRTVWKALSWLKFSLSMSTMSSCSFLWHVTRAFGVM